MPPRSTVIVATNESIWVSPKIAGTYHSKVSLVSKGLGHIGTTLDPTFLGTSFIALHNVSEREIKLVPGEDTFVSVTFYYLRTEANDQYQEVHDNNPGRRDLVDVINPGENDSEWLRQDFRVKKKSLERKLKNDSDYQSLRKSYSRWIYGVRFSVPYLVCLILIAMGTYLGNSAPGTRSAFIADKIATVAIGGLIAQAVLDIRRKG